MKYILLLGLLFVGAGCAAKSQLELSTMPTKSNEQVEVLPAVTTPPTVKTPEGMKDSAMVKAKQSYYLSYTREQFEVAKADKQPVLLYFYASWCPICRAEEPGLKTAVEGSSLSIAGFRVNYNDPETDNDEQSLAKEYGVAYQHTTVILDRSGQESSRFTGPIDGATLKAALEKAAK